MARRKKDGKRGPGIQGKKGNLYIIISQTALVDGVRKTTTKWISTGLPDTLENIKKAELARINILKSDAFNLNYDISLSDYIDYYLSIKKDVVADTTYASYTYQAQRIKFYFGNTKLKKLDTKLANHFFNDLFIKQHLQIRTVKDTKVFLSSTLEQARNDGLISYNPVKEIKINKNLAAEYSAPKNKEDSFFTYDEANLFLQRIQDHELYAIFYLTIFFGLRREEVLGLKWSAINFKTKTMRINHTVTKGTKVNRLNRTKTEYSNREYPLSDDQIELFRSILKKEQKNRKLFGNCYQDNDYVFKHEDGSLFYPDYPSKTFRALLKTIPELPQGVVFHNLRSSCVSILVHEGLDVKSIQKWVGHADIDTTLRIYAKVKEKEVKEEISRSMSERIHLSNCN